MEGESGCGMVKKYFFRVIGIGLLLAPCASYAAMGDAGTYGAFLTYWGPSARALGMAGALSGMADDVSAGYFNPAGLVQLNTQEISFMHSIVFAGFGTSADVLMYGRPATATSGFGITVFHLYTPGIDYSDRTRPRTGYTYTNRETAGLITYSTRLIGPVWIGTNAKVFHHQIFRYGSMGFGADFGLFFFPEQLFSLGINLQNVVRPSVKLDSLSNSFPMTLRSGFSMRPWGGKLAIATDMIWSMSQSKEWAQERKPVFGAGIEYKPLPILFLRTGFNQSYAGMGLGLWKDQKTYEIIFDYAFEIPYATGGIFGLGHNFSISILFGGYRAKAHSPVVAFSPTSGEEGKNVCWLYFNVVPRTEVKKWQVLIKDETGTVVRKIEAWGQPPYRVAWDGKDDNAILVPDGRYYYALKVVERNEKTWDYEGFLTSMYTIGPPGTVLIRSERGEQPKYMLEERKEEKKKEEERKRVRRR